MDLPWNAHTQDARSREGDGAMLVLSRRTHERVLIVLTDGRLVAVEVLDCAAGRCRVGIEAPQDITVHREEVWRIIGDRRTEPRGMERAGCARTRRW